MGLVGATTLRIDELRSWWSSLDPTFVFLLALPVVVIVAGFARDAWDRHQTGRTVGTIPGAKGRSGDLT